MTLWYALLWIIGLGLILYGVFELAMVRKKWLFAALAVIIGILIMPNGIVITRP